MSSSRGKLVVIEGLDKAGKSTQCEKLEARLSTKGGKVKRIQFPDRSTPTGKLIDAYLKGESEQDDHAIHLLFSANRWEAASKIKADIKAGVHVIVDRYYYSGCVYSAAKNASLSLAWARKADEGLPRPDVVIFLGITPDEAAGRGGYGNERYEDRSTQARVRQLFAQLQKVQPEKQDFVRVDGGKHVDDVAEDVWEAVQKAFRNADLYGDTLRTVEAWDDETNRSVNAAVAKMEPAKETTPAAAAAATAAAENATLDKRSLQAQWDTGVQGLAPKVRGIKIQGDGMGNRKTTEKNWWEYE